jgi:hypothetical protein
MSASDQTPSPEPASKAESEAEAPAAEQGLDLVGFQKFMDTRQEKEEKKYAEVATSSDYPTLLSDALALYQDVQQFSTGDFVQWKPMMRNRRFPLESVPAIVVDLIDPPLTTDAEGDRLVEPRDLLIAVIDGDQDFVLVEVAARRLTEWKP